MCRAAGKTLHIDQTAPCTPLDFFTDPPYNIPAACATIKYAFPSGLPLAEMGCETPMEVLELVRNFVADDIRQINDFSPSVLREIVRRTRALDDWRWNNQRLANPVRCEPKWLVTHCDPSVGHDAGLYRGAGAVKIKECKGGTMLYGWPLTEGGKVSWLVS